MLVKDSLPSSITHLHPIRESDNTYLLVAHRLIIVVSSLGVETLLYQDFHCPLGDPVQMAEKGTENMLLLPCFVSMKGV